MGFQPNKELLLDGVTTTASSRWVEVWPYEDVTLHFWGLVSGDTVIVEASNEDGDPSNEVQFGTTITEDDIAMLNELPYKIRVRVTATAGGGNISVMMVARRPM